MGFRDLMNNYYYGKQGKADMTVADLPASGNEIGDFYNIIATGENYAWDGTAWDQTGSIVDLQPITNAEIDVIVAS